jgi:hypothetical protein
MRWMIPILILPLAFLGQAVPGTYLSKVTKLTWDPPTLDASGNPLGAPLVAAKVAVSDISIDLRTGGASLFEMTVDSASGSFPISTLVAPLKPGQYRFYAQVQDAAGNWSEWSDFFQATFIPIGPAPPNKVRVAVGAK